MYKFKFADIGEGLHEGKVAEIYKNVGDVVKEGDSLFSVETDKVTSDIPSPVDGKIVEVLMAEGDTIHVGQDVYHFDDGSGDSAPAKEETKEEAAPKAAGASVVGDIKVSDDVLDLSSLSKKESSKEVVVRTGKTGSKVRNNDGKVTTPLARSKAAELGVDIAQVTGTGFNGRVLVKDVEAFTPGAKATTATKSPAKPMVSTGEDVRIKVPGIRKAIAGAMKNSWAQVAYTNLVVEVNMSSLWDFRKTITDERSIKRFGTKVTFLPFIMKATTIALKEFPMINAKYDEAANEMIQYADVNLGVAVDSPKGLMVPVVKQMQTKSIVEVNKEIQALAGLVRTGKITGKDMSGATFTVTNYGSAGALHGVPVINYPEIGILGTGAIIDRVLTDKSGGFYTGKIMHLTCAADHRWVDGADIGRFVSRVKELLENPAQLGVF